MRYSNWDVLLFPERSRVPIQEFRTQCCVVGDKDSPYLNAPYFNSQLFYAQRSLGQLPVLTSFIPSLPAQSPFRISIHSWEKPQPSRILESLMHPDDCVLYEVRIYTDNVCVAGSLFGPRTAWPHLLDFSSQVDKNGTQEVLRFPQFHPEVIDSYVWDAAETHGRLRVVISEGFSRPNRSPPFERVKDVVVFSFQHAPLNILENCGIAWPNPNMWNQLPTNLFRHQLSYGGYGGGNTGGYGAFPEYDSHKKNDELHAHSPTRHDTTRYEPSRVNGFEASYHNTYSNVPQWAHKPIVPTAVPESAPAPLPAMNWPGFTMDPRLNLHPTNFGTFQNQGAGFMGSADPFIEPLLAHRLRRTQRSIDDVSMPDAGPISVSSRAMSSVNGMSYEHSHQTSMAASQEDDSLSFMGPMNPSKIHTTTATTASTQQTTVPSMPPVSRPSAAALARSESYSKRNSQADPKDIRQISGSSTRSGQTDSVVESISTRKVVVSPKGQVKGKKESKGLTKKSNRVESEPASEPSSREVSRSSTHHPHAVVRTTESVVHVSSETKRKRHSKAPDEASQTSESPTKKISRVEKVHSVAEDDDID